MRNSISTLLFIILVSISCNKEEVVLPNSPPSLTPTPEVPVVQSIETKKITTNFQGNSTQKFHNSIIKTQTTLIEIFITILKESIIQPGLHNLTGEVADTRDCPDRILTGVGGAPADFFKTLVLNFNGTTGCLLGGVTYVGELTIEFEAALGETDPDNPDIKIIIDDNFMINGHDITLSSGTILMDKNNNAFGYNFIIMDDDLRITIGDVLTSIPGGTTGVFDLEEVAGSNDDPATPSDYWDNPFSLSISEALITCENVVTSAQSEFCTITDEPIKLQPTVCTCPVDGVLRMKDNNGDCDTEFDLMNSTAYDFGDGTCNNAGSVVIQEKIVEFLSYEGDITANEKAADGFSSQDINVVESDSTPEGHSLQLKGTGSSSLDFIWNSPSTATMGSINNGQTMVSSNSSHLPWINEIHYDNISTDTNEFIEIAGPAGLELSDYTLIIYNGDGTSRREEVLSGIFANESNGFGFYVVPLPSSFSLQNDTEGYALVKSSTISGEVPLGYCN